jgi:hypothetical protein
MAQFRKIFGKSDKIGLATKIQQNAYLASGVDIADDRARVGRAVSFLLSDGFSSGPQDVFGFFDIAVRFHQGFFAFGNRDTRFLSQLFDLVDGYHRFFKKY